MSKQSAEHHRQAADHHEHAANHHRLRNITTPEITRKPVITPDVARGHHLHAEHYSEEATKHYANEHGHHK